MWQVSKMTRDDSRFPLSNPPHPTSHPAHQLSVWIIQSLFYLNLILKYSLQHKQHCCPPGVQFHVLCRQVHRAKNQPIQVLTLLLTFSEEKGTTEDEMAGWHRWLDGRNSEWTPGVGDGQGGLVCCDSWGHEESDTTERLNWTELNWTEPSQTNYFPRPQIWN